MSPRHSVVGQNDEWQDPLENLAERLDRFQSGGSGSDSEQQLAWSLFAELSPYSPVRLDSELGWRPIPTDLPSHCDPNYFGWTDAFEDLLSVSSARPMMSLERRQLMNQAITFSPLASNPFWNLYDRVTWQKLDEAYFPLYIPGKRYRSPRTMEEWVTLRKAQTGMIPSDDWVKAIEMLGKDIETEMAVIAPFLFPNRFHHAREHTPVSLYQWLNSLFNDTAGEDNEERSKEKQSSSSGPKTEEDMYNRDSQQKSKGADAANPLGTLLSILKNAVTGDDERQHQQQHHHHQPSPEEGKKEVSVKGPILEQTRRETKDGGSEIVKKSVKEVPGLGEVRTIEVERKDKLGRTVSVEVHSHTVDTPGEWIPSYWKKIWDSGQASGGERKSTDDKDAK